jgi:uncharacterized protein with PQ loop repeat
MHEAKDTNICVQSSQNTPKKTLNIDSLVYFAAIFGPLVTLPQVYDIWILRKTEISVVTWVGYIVAALIWLVYGLKHGSKPIVFTQSAWIVISSLIVVGVFIA